MTKTISIEPNKTIEELQAEFNKFYPYLKIEFFKAPSIKGQRFSKDKMISSKEKLGNLQRTRTSGEISFTDNTTVGEFEIAFFEKFNMALQVFRKSGNVWLETSATDNWSLEQQNAEGKSLAQHWKIERENPDDHDIY